MKKMLMKNPTKGKLEPNLVSPFKIISKAGQAAYRLEDMERKALPQPWNAQHLKIVLLLK